MKDNASQAKQTLKKCPLCQEEIQPAAQICKHCGYKSPLARRMLGAQPTLFHENANPPKVSTGLASAVITLFICLPLGLIALIFSAQSRVKLSAGDYAGAKVSGATATGIAVIGDILGLLAVVYYVFG